LIKDSGTRKGAISERKKERGGREGNAISSGRGKRKNQRLIQIYRENAELDKAK